MVYADLHVHTDCSDGEMALSEVPDVARRADVSVVAITDHDRIHPNLPAPLVVYPAEGPTRSLSSPAATIDEGEVLLVRGIELRVEADDQRVDLLGYGLERTDGIESMVGRIQIDRKERGRAIIECVEDRLGVDLDLEPRTGLGRPHVARAIDANPDTDLDYEGAFREVIGDDCPCYVARDVPDFEAGLETLRESCRLVGLAHPLRYPDPEAALELTSDLDAVERPYPYGREVDLRPVDRAVHEHDLVVTGGSDAHDDRLGRAGLDRGEYERVRTAL